VVVVVVLVVKEGTVTVIYLWMNSAT